MDGGVDWKLAEPGSEGSDQQHNVQLEASHYWCTPGTGTGDNTV